MNTYQDISASPDPGFTGTFGPPRNVVRSLPSVLCEGGSGKARFEGGIQVSLNKVFVRTVFLRMLAPSVLISFQFYL